MKRLHISLVNHAPTWRKTLVDLVDWVVTGFTENGFEVTVADADFVPGVPNLIFENNLGHKAFMNYFARGQRRFPFISFVTEVIVGDKFDDWSGSWDGAARYRDFLELAQHVDGFLTTVPANVEPLRQLAPASFFEFGFSERLASAVPPEQWEFDYSFAGALTAHRAAFLSDISGRGLRVTMPAGMAGRVKHTAAVAPNDAYLRTIQYAAVNLCLKQHAGWRLPSPTRLGRIGHAMTGCALEQTAEVTRQSALFPTFSGVDDFVAKFGAVDRARIRREAVDRLDSYRRTLPLKAEIARNIDECPVLGGTAKPPVAS
jgi:hypothetical protein